MGFILLAILKFIGALLVFPIVYASAVTFYHHLGVYPESFQEYFFWGALSFLLTYLFFYKYGSAYELSQRINTGLFKILAPFDKFFAYLFPIYFFIVLIAYVVVTQFFHCDDYSAYLIFFMGFFLAFHLILVAQQMQEEEAAIVKPSYLLIMSIVVVVILLLSVLFFDLILQKTSFNEYFSGVYSISEDIYRTVFNKAMSYRK